MAVKKGQYAEVEIQTTGGATPVYTPVAKLREWSISSESEKIDSTAAGDDWTTHEIGVSSWEGEATCIDIDTFWFAKLREKVVIRFYDDAGDATPVFTGTASIDFERTSPYDDLIETTLTFTGSGPLTVGA